MMIFPLSVFAKIALVLIMLFIIMIYTMMAYPEFWKRRFRQDRPSRFVKALDSFQAAKERKKLRKANR
jgi:hypothetical protein